jgi:hypothetical protein
MWQAIAPYKNRNPGSIDEEEYLENLFNSLCACLMSVETRDLFNKAEGALPTSNPLTPPPLPAHSRPCQGSQKKRHGWIGVKIGGNQKPWGGGSCLSMSNHGRLVTLPEAIGPE